MRKLRLKEQDEWALKAKMDHEIYLREQQESKKACEDYLIEQIKNDF